MYTWRIKSRSGILKLRVPYCGCASHIQVYQQASRCRHRFVALLLILAVFVKVAPERKKTPKCSDVGSGWSSSQMLHRASREYEAVPKNVFVYFFQTPSMLAFNIQLIVNLSSMKLSRSGQPQNLCIHLWCQLHEAASFSCCCCFHTPLLQENRHAAVFTTADVLDQLSTSSTV